MNHTVHSERPSARREENEKKKRGYTLSHLYIKSEKETFAKAYALPCTHARQREEKEYDYQIYRYITDKMVREVDIITSPHCSIDHIATKLADHDGVRVEDQPNKYESISKPRTSTTDEESGFGESTGSSACSSPIPSLTDDDYELASTLSDDSKKEFCSDMGLVFHAEFQLTFGRYFTADQWILLPLGLDGACKLPPDTICDVEIAKVRFECEGCGHCWTSMRGQVSFFYHCDSHVLYFKLFTQNCDRCNEISSPLWYPEEVCRVLRNVFVIINQQLYPERLTPIQPNHYRRFGNPKGQHHGCESCRDGVCVALAAQELGCKLVK